MVKEIVGNGEIYRDLFQANGGDLSSHSRILFVEGEHCDEQDVFRKLAKTPSFFVQSTICRNVRDPYGKKVDALFVPKECPKLRENKYELVDELPPENETYIVDTWKTDEQGFFEEILILADDEEQATRFAKRRAINKFGVSKKLINAQATLVSPEEWVDKAKELINKGTRLPDFIMRWAGLQSYADSRAAQIAS